MKNWHLLTLIIHGKDMPLKTKKKEKYILLCISQYIGYILYVVDNNMHKSHQQVDLIPTGI